MAGFDKIEQIVNIKVSGSSDIAQLSKNIEVLKNRQSDLRKQSKQTTDEYQKNKVAMKALTSEYNKAAKEVANLATNQKKATSFTSKMSSSIANATMKVAGMIGAFTSINRVLSSMFKTMRDFEFGMAKVRAISGATGEEFEALKNSAQILGRTTFFTASQVAQLQLNLSKLGFSSREILNAQEAILQLSTAMGDDLGRTATVVASSLRGFGESTVETQRYVDVMAKSFSSSQLDLEKFQTSMSKVSAIASMAGFSFEETTALLGTLTDRGIEASIAGTSLRNILLHLQDPTSDLSERLGRTVHSGRDLIIALKELRDSGINVAGVMGIVQKRQVMAMNSFIDSSDSLGEFISSLNDAVDVAGGMSDIMENTVTGSLNITKSAWEGFVLSIENGDGRISKSIKSILDSFSSVLNKLAYINSSSGLMRDEIVTNSIESAKSMADELNRQLIKFGKEPKWKHTDFLPTGNIKKEIEELEIALQASKDGIILGLESSWGEADRETLQKEIDARKMALTSLAKYVEDVEVENKRLAEEQKKEFERQKKQAEAEKQRQADLEKSAAETAERKAEKARKDKERKEADELKKFEQGIVDDAEANAAEARQGYLQAYLDGQMSKEQLDAQLHQAELDRLREIQQEREKAGLSTMEISEKILQMKQKEKSASDEAAAAAEEKANKEAQADKEKTQKMMQNAIMSSDNAAQAFQKILEVKINEILLDAMASMWKDGTIPFPAKIALAVGMKSIVSPMISNLLGGSGKKYAKGGLTEGGMFQGPSHANGGVKFAAGGRIHEAEGGEAIINKRSTSMFKPLLSAINSHNGYGKKFALGGITDGVHSKYALGGMTSSSIGDIVSGGMAAQTVMVVESDITTTQGRVSAIEAQASF